MNTGSICVSSLFLCFLYFRVRQVTRLNVKYSYVQKTFTINEPTIYKIDDEQSES